MAESAFGCHACGKLAEERGDGVCAECGAPLIELGGDPSPDKAAALIAFARRDATHVRESVGAVAGAVLGALLAAIPSVLDAWPAAFGVCAALYGGILGAVLGRMLTWRVYRLLRPGSPLQPLVHPRERQSQLQMVLLLLAIPILAAVVHFTGGWRALLRWMTARLGE